MSDQPGAPPASAASDALRFTGHIGHLTEGEHNALDTLKQLATKNGLFTEDGPGGKPTHDDATLVYGGCSQIRK